MVDSDDCDEESELVGMADSAYPSQRPLTPTRGRSQEWAKQDRKGSCLPLAATWILLVLVAYATISWHETSMQQSGELAEELEVLQRKLEARGIGAGQNGTPAALFASRVQELEREVEELKGELEKERGEGKDAVFTGNVQPDENTQAIANAASLSAKGKALTEPFGIALLRQWMSDPCQQFYARNKSQCPPQLSVEQIQDLNASGWLAPRTCALEDFHRPGGRAKAVTSNVPGKKAHLVGGVWSRWGSEGTKPANEFIVNHEYKVVYVENRKCGSSSTLAMMKQVFGADFSNSCHNWPKNCHSGSPLVRCSTACLPQFATEHNISSYFFFTFVRDPVDRFFSAFKENVARTTVGVDMNKPAAVKSRILAILDQIERGHTVMDSHFESQAYSLSSTVHAGSSDAMLRFNFIEDLRNMAPSLPHLFKKIEENAGKQIPAEKKKQALVDLGHKNPTPERIKERLARVRTPDLERRIRQVYAQDAVCFSGGST